MLYTICTNCLFVAAFTANNFTVDVTIPTQPGSVTVTSVFGWIAIQQRIGNAFNWNLNWQSYKDGFGSIEADYWLGLERMHLLTTSQPYRLRVEMEQESTGNL